jgi:hypothetical protein
MDRLELSSIVFVYRAARRRRDRPTCLAHNVCGAKAQPAEPAPGV